MDYDALRQGLEQAVPFNRHVGIAIREVAQGRGVAALPDSDRTRNHVGTQHAGALFSTGEAASGAAFIGVFAERLGDIAPVARSAEITYAKRARGEVLAKARLERDGDELLAALDADGRVEFPVEVSIEDVEGECARMVVHWHVSAT